MGLTEVSEKIEMKIIRPEEFPDGYIKRLKCAKRSRGNQGTKDLKYYKDIVTAFDIETANLHPEEQAIMYCWQWCFGSDFVVFGRTWDEFRKICEKICSELDRDEWLVVYDHNLSFEFQFLTGIYNFTVDEVFAVGPRKVLKAQMCGHFEFRCSYLHSNMSLLKYTEKMGAKHVKLDGDEFDYHVERYPWTDLTDRQIEYAVVDVIGLVEAATNEMNLDGDSLYTIPLTSTGYVRRDAKHAMKSVNHLYIQSITPTWGLYKRMREAFRGGDVHANRYYAGRIIPKVKSFDRSSSYPAVLVNRQFPVRPFFHAGKMTIEQVIDCMNRRKKAILMAVRIWDLRLQDDGWGAPYLSKDKCRNIKNGAYDNGRILSADYLETTITDVDLRIILDQYDFECLDPVDVYHATYGMLPKAFRDLIIEYYQKKTDLKGVPDQEYFYMKVKNKINSLYGMCAQDPVKISDIYDAKDPEGNFWKSSEEKLPEQILEESNKKAFLVYQWGVWTTAWARYELQKGIRAAALHNKCGYDGFVYCDTDSVKYVGEIDLDAYNAERIRESDENEAYATDPAGNRHYMGVFEYEGQYDRFITLGAKKYAYEENGTLHITVAGVGKKKGAKELSEHGGLEAFKLGFVWKDAGGTEAVYNDKEPEQDVIREGRRIKVTRNLLIRDSEYTLGVTGEYLALLDSPKILHRIGIDNFKRNL